MADVHRLALVADKHYPDRNGRHVNHAGTANYCNVTWSKRHPVLCARHTDLAGMVKTPSHLQDYYGCNSDGMDNGLLCMAFPCDGLG